MPPVVNRRHPYSLYVCKEPAAMLGSAQTSLLSSGCRGPAALSITPRLLHLQENILNDSKRCFVTSCMKTQ